MELRQLEHFVAVAEERHFTHAAARCHIAQSALSRSIRTLEHELGSQLLVRTTRLVELTECGRHFLAEARRTLDAAASARAVIDQVNGLQRGTLSIGAVPTAGLLDLPRLLTVFHRRHPGIEIKLLGGGGSPMLIESVQGGRLDLALVTMPRRLTRKLDATLLASEPYMFVCSPEHPLGTERSVTLNDVVSETFVDFQVGAALRAVNDRVFAEAGMERRVTFEIDQPATLLGIVAEGLAVAIVPRYFTTGSDRVRSVPLNGNDILPWNLCAITPASRPLSGAARSFLDLVVATSTSVALRPQPC